MLDKSKVKFNITSLAAFKNKRSRYNKFYSFETCDICNKQGVKFEVIKYTGLFDLNLIKQAIPYKSYGEISKFFSERVTGGRFLYVIFYTCSEECNGLLVLQQMK